MQPSDLDMKTPDDLDRLIHEPARFFIMAHLYVVKEADFVLLIRQTGLTGGNLSSHAARLEEAGYLEVEKSFVDRRPQTLYRLTPSGRKAFQHYREVMSSLLDHAGPDLNRSSETRPQ